MDEENYLFEHEDGDGDRFNRAAQTDDVPELIDLLKSEEEIGPMEKKVHPWASDPKTIGALAATRLAILAVNDPFKDSIREAKGLPALLTLMKSRAEDRVHAAVVAISFMSHDNYANQWELYKEGAIAPLVKGLSSSIDGMRAACAQTLRNIYVIDENAKKAFAMEGGVQRLVNLLDYPGGNAADVDFTTHLEATWHIEDLVYHDDQIIPEMRREVDRAGVLTKLERLNEIVTPLLEDPELETTDPKRFNDLTEFRQACTTLHAQLSQENPTEEADK
eukprot:GHVU01064387.1.p1 GENE.GHVU01064387.1~~GHVU01064387.1.p1  ORF type:complete len:277 (-),score=75.73 GHVU01064387.1:284-1114(-)